MIFKKRLLILILTVLFGFPGIRADIAFNENLSVKERNEIDRYVERQMEKGRLPGVAIVIVKGVDTVYKRCYGFSDSRRKKTVTAETLFELGSMSKAFTALGILHLRNQNLISIEAPVADYIPWLQFKYEGKPAEVTLRQFMNQTSGIPFRSIAHIPAGSADDALEKTVRTLIGTELDHRPGRRFTYATINYDVLGLVIQRVSGISFEKYMKTNILETLGLHHTYVSRDEAPGRHMSKGYKIRFGRACEYEAPVFRGNTPAGYFITNIDDLARWLRIQMRIEASPGIDKALIAESQEPNGKIFSPYGAGWYNVYDYGRKIFHGGANPNFSSFIVFRPKDRIGAAVLANMHSRFAEDIPPGILAILQGKNPPATGGDLYLEVDHLSSFAVLGLAPLIVLISIFLAMLTVRICQGKRNFRGISRKGVLIFSGLTLFLAGIYYFIYSLPYILFWQLPWDFVRIWGPATLWYGVTAVILLFFLMYLYLLLRFFFQKAKASNQVGKK